MAEATRRRDWAARRAADGRPSRAPASTTRAYRTKVRRIVWGHVIVRAEGDGRVRSATIAPAGPDWAPAGAERTFEVDAVCTAYGFLPVGRPGPRARLRARRRRRRPRRGHADLGPRACSWRARRRASAAPTSPWSRASSRAAWPPPRPRAGATARRAAGARPRPAARGARRARGCAGLRRASSADLFDPRPGLLALADAGHDAVPLRGRDRGRGRRRGGGSGATTLAALKVVTRCGQGPCQGRICERLVAARLSRSPSASAPARRSGRFRSVC